MWNGMRGQLVMPARIVELIGVNSKNEMLQMLQMLQHV